MRRFSLSMLSGSSACSRWGPLYGVSGWSIALVVVALALLVSSAISFLAQHRLLVATSMTDALTGIPNRRKPKADLERRLKEASPANPLPLMLFGLSGFNGYNDSFGHPAGDALLIRLAGALEQAMTELGGGFHITAAYGLILLPRRARTS